MGESTIMQDRKPKGRLQVTDLASMQYQARISFPSTYLSIDLHHGFHEQASKIVWNLARLGQHLQQNSSIETWDGQP